MKKNRKNQTRNHPRQELYYRSLGVRLQSTADGPSTLDADARTVEVVAATENPTLVYDYDRWSLVSEVLLMSGARLPARRQIPLLDTHSRWSSSDVIGSARQLSVSGSELHAVAHFSEVEPAPDIFRKIQEGHLTDFSIGYRVNKSVWVPEKQTQTINGRIFTGPVKVATDWTVKELSTTPIGADELAKARSERHERGKEALTMPEWLIKWLEGRGLYREGMSEAEGRELFMQEEMRSEPPQPPAASPEVPVVPAPPASDPATVRADAIRVEQGRIMEITAMCRRFGCEDMTDGLIRTSTSIEGARKVVLDTIESRFEGGRGFRPSIESGQDERDKFRSAANDSILLRLGQFQDVSKAAPGATELASYSLRELAREALRMAGLSTSGNVLQMVGRALVSSDLPYALAAGANKMLLAGWAAQDTTYQIWCGIDSLPDFKTMNIVSISEADDLDEVPEGAKYNHGDIVDAREQAYLLTYGKIFSITRQAIINDDLNVMMRLPESYGRSARRKVNGLAYGVLINNANMADGIALFHASHSNLGTGGVISKTTIGEMFKLMKMQKGPKSAEPLNIIPKYLMAPVTQEATSEAFFNTIQIANAAGDVLINQYSGSRITRVYDPILDDTDTTDWFMAAEKGMTVTVFFLQGQSEPYLEQKQGWDVDGAELKVRIDAAAKAVDWRGLTKNEGE